VGAIEPQFYAELLRILELDPEEFFQFDRERWPEFKQRFAEVFRTRTRDEWAAVLEPAEACATPVLKPGEAAAHPHNVARNAFVEVNGVVQPGPAPRFSRTVAQIRRPPSEAGADTDEALGAWGLSAAEIAALRGSGAVG
jgi:alpha-methylacyl-CoA racemase